jgi:hypothetical protein
MASNVIIEFPSDGAWDILCITSDTFVDHVQDMQITKTTIRDAYCQLILD